MNFVRITDYLRSFKSRLKLTALLETWLNEEKGVDFHIEGYELHYMNRTNKRGGGVALYVDSDLKCKLIKNMT